jgi:hypothetical protein
MMSSTHQTSTDTDVFVYTGDGGAEVPDDVVRVLVDPSVTSIPVKHFTTARSWPRWSCVKALLKLGKVPSGGAAVRLPK